jgi:hypothetical protein
MPNKDLLVRAECVDLRNGKRYFKGQYFDPVPTGEQARRLFIAGCLPEGAIKLGEAEDAKLAKKAEDDAATTEKITKRQAVIVAAVNAKARAEVALDTAKDELDRAATDAEKTAAADAVKAAEATLTSAVEALDKAQK